MSGRTLPRGRRPNLLGIGAAKAGTTWLALLLGKHPDIFVPLQKELNTLHYNDIEARLGEYIEHFKDAERASIRCDFSVRYLASMNATRAAARYTPDARVLLVARNPIDQIQSHYWHLRRQNFHQAAPVAPVPDLFDALSRYPQLLLEPALYGKHLLRWLEVFPRERILVLRYEDLMQDRDRTLDTLCDFLDVARLDFTAASAAITLAQGRRGVSPRGGALGGLYPMLYVAIAHHGLGALKSTIGVRRTEALKRGLRLRRLGELVFFRPGYEKLGTEGRARLWSLVQADVARFASLTALDVAGWEAAP